MDGILVLYAYCNVTTCLVKVHPVNFSLSCTVSQEATTVWISMIWCFEADIFQSPKTQEFYIPTTIHQVFIGFRFQI